jgi:hypothetical protein
MLHIDKSVPPVARPHYRIPFHNRPKVEAELKKLLEADIIEKVNGPTEWMSRIVTPPKPKNPEEIRICVDMRDANKAILRTRHVTPTIEELSTALNGASVFSTIDLRSGYRQLVLHSACRYITCFSTHIGIFQYKRLNFGVNSAAEVFQHTIQSVIEDIPGARNVSDDIIVFGKNKTEHDRALRATLRKLHESGLTINPKKCQLNRPEVEFFGFVFNQHGYSPAPEKVAELSQMPTPSNTAELRSFLGMAQYSARFIPGFSTLSEPLRRLTKKDCPWCWTPAQTKAFKAIKESLQTASANAYFDPNKETTVYVDASPVGLAAILTQEEKTIICASRALSPVEQRYSQTEREALAIVWACEHLHIYLCGSPFTIVTDHQPLTSIWLKPDPPLRIARWGLRLQGYSVNIVYQPGSSNPADYLSRHPRQCSKPTRQSKRAEEYVHAVVTSSTPKSLSLQEIAVATENDDTMKTVIECVSRSAKHIPHREFQTIKNELSTYQSEHGTVLLRDRRIVIPESLQSRVIELAHIGHQGICKTKALLRSKVWFPRLDKAVEDTISTCIACQANSRAIPATPLQMSELPAHPWLELSIDFLSASLPTGEYILVIVDEYSRYPLAEMVKTTSFAAIQPVLRRVFATFGFPSVIKSDNGPPFQGHEFAEYMNHCGIRHRKITPLWPKANAQAEGFNKPLIKAIRAAHVEGKQWQETTILDFLQAYRATPHVSTKFSPITSYLAVIQSPTYPQCLKPRILTPLTMLFANMTNSLRKR